MVLYRILLLSSLIYKLFSNGITIGEDINLVVPALQLFHSPYYFQEDKYLGIFNNCNCHKTPDLFAYCYGENCKDFPILSIDVPLFKLHLSSIVIIRKNDFRLLKDLEGLEIEGNNFLKSIESGCFKQMNKLQNLTITNNYKLKYLEENVFEGLKNLMILSLAKNGFKQVKDATKCLSTKYLPNLQLLDLSQNIIHTVEQFEFYSMNGTSLQELNLFLCGIFYIHPNSLQPFSNLIKFRIGENLCNKTTLTNLIIQTIEYNPGLALINLFSSGFRRTLPLELLQAIGKSNITDIIWARNHFDEINDDSFPEMKNLLTMDLRECNINSISNGAFRKVLNIRELQLNKNRLSTVPLGALLPKLILLDLAGNSQEQNYFFIPDRIFQNLTILENLQLAYNNIQYIKKETFFGLGNLLILNLKNTQLNYIEDCGFIYLKKLLQLNLSKNPLLVLNVQTFRGLHSVNVTELAYCGLKNLTTNPGILYYFKNITYLDLSNNEIQHISPDQLSHLWNLTMVHLENNSLHPWNIPIFPKNKYKEINLSQNKYTYLTKAMLEDFKSTEILNLDGNGNSFRCDCSLYPLVQWLDYNKMNYIENNVIAKCDTPEKWQKISIVEYFKYLQNTTDCRPLFTIYHLVSLILSIILLIILLVILYLIRWHIKYWIFLSRLTIMKHWTVKKPQELFNYQYDAFVSYSVDDKFWVTQLCKELEPSLKLCIFERDFPPGSAISQAILTSVASSKRTILVVSESFARSSWCRWETQIAQYHQIFFRGDSAVGPDDTLVLVKLEAVNNATPILRYLLKTRIYLEWPKEKDRQGLFWDKLRYTLLRPKS